MVARGPPYVPEIHPIYLAWSCLDTAYNTRYANSTHVSDFLIQFAESVQEDRLLATVRRAEDFTEKLASAEETILVYDDMGAPFPEERSRDGGPEMGIAHAEVGEMWGYRAWMAHGEGGPYPR